MQRAVNRITNISNKIGNNTMGTEATTVTGAIAEHENDLTSVNDKIAKISTGGEQLAPASLDALKTGLLTVADSVNTNQFIGIRIYPSFTANGFIAETTYCGYLYNIYKDNGTTVYLSASIYNNLGEDMIIAYNNGTWTFNSLTDKTQAIISNLTTQIMQSIYPIGSIYSSTESTSPATLFGFGTWEQIKDKFLLAAGDTYEAGNTGGAASASYTPAGTVGGHTLTVDEIPSHNHTFTGNAVNTGNNSVGHTHTYTDYYATTTGGTAITEANMRAHSHHMFANVAISRAGGAYAALAYTNDSSSEAPYRYWIQTTNQATPSAASSSTIGSSTSHTHSGANTSTTRTSDGISANHTHSVTASGSIGSKGGGGSHSHSFTGTAATISTIPPYLAVYMWKRIS